MIAITFVAAVRLRVANVPLERDEGEYAYAGQLIRQGIPPYTLAYNMKFPGTYYAYSLILGVFGETARGIRIGLLLVNAATTWFVFLLGRRFLGAFGGSIGAVTFALLSVDPWIMGVFAHATHFALLPVLAALYLMLSASDTNQATRELASGMLLGVAVLMKQHAVFFVPLAAAMPLWSAVQPRRQTHGRAATHGLIVLLGALIPFAVLCMLFAFQGVLGKFWFWTFQYAKEYVLETPLSEAWPTLVWRWKSVTPVTGPIWLLALTGAFLLWLIPWAPGARGFLSGLTVASTLAIAPGFYFREHYFILLLPAVALLAAVAVVSIRCVAARALSPTDARSVAIASFLVVAAPYFAGEFRFFFVLPVATLSRGLYGANPFVEAEHIAQYIREHTTDDDRVAVVGSEPEIYFYANRKSATGYIYTYPLLEPQAYASWMQDDMIREVEMAHPSYVVFVDVFTSWGPVRSSDRILAWSQRYLQACYDRVGIADIDARGDTVMLWDSDAANYRPRSQDVVYTFRRRSAEPCAAER